MESYLGPGELWGREAMRAAVAQGGVGSRFGLGSPLPHPCLFLDDPVLRLCCCLPPSKVAIPRDTAGQIKHMSSPSQKVPRLCGGNAWLLSRLFFKGP